MTRTNRTYARGINSRRLIKHKEASSLKARKTAKILKMKKKKKKKCGIKLKLYSNRYKDWKHFERIHKEVSK